MSNLATEFAIGKTSRKAMRIVASVWLGLLSVHAAAQTFDSEHCPPIVPCSQTSSLPEGHLPEGCTCQSGNDLTPPPPLPAPPGCDPDDVKKQISTLKGTLKFLTAPPSCQITPDQCDALPNRKTVTLSDGTAVCQPKVCSPQCYTFGQKDVGPFSFGGVKVCSTCLSLPVKPKNSFDPNNKQGPVGATTMQFVRGDTPLSYTIHFENLATATAPAQVVVVTDQLDPQQVDLATFRLGPIAFGSDNTFAPAPGVRGWTGSVDLRPDQNLIVTINAGIDVTTGLVTWRFASIDPSTEQLTTDPSAGFLPPNTNPPDGEGGVVFTVMPKSGLLTGTAIHNQATVVFDTNKPIATPTWFNTIDKDPPVTHVLPLPATQALTTFPVQWTGTDVGSGIGAFTIFVSDNGGPFSVWLDLVTGASSMYTGQVGHSYGFFSVGVDLAGNLEPLKTVAEASTQIVTGPLCGNNVSGQVQVTRSGFGYTFSTGRFVQTVTLKNTSASAITGPLSLVLDGLSNATLFNAGGTTACALPAGSPYIGLTGNLASGGSASLTLQFTDPSHAGITYTTRVLAGNGAR